MVKGEACLAIYFRHPGSGCYWWCKGDVLLTREEVVALLASDKVRLHAYELLDRSDGVTVRVAHVDPAHWDPDCHGAVEEGFFRAPGVVVIASSCFSERFPWLQPDGADFRFVRATERGV